MKRAMNILLTAVVASALAWLPAGAAYWGPVQPYPDPYYETNYVLTQDTYEPDLAGTLTQRITVSVLPSGTPDVWDVVYQLEVDNGGVLALQEEKIGTRTFTYAGIQTVIEQTVDVYTSDPLGSPLVLTGKEDFYWEETDTDRVACDYYYTWDGVSYTQQSVIMKHRYERDTQTPYEIHLFYERTVNVPPTMIIPSSFPVINYAEPAGIGGDLMQEPGQTRDWWRYQNLLMRNQNTSEEIHRALLVDHGADGAAMLVPPVPCDDPETGVYLWSFHYIDNTNDNPPGMGFTGFYQHWARAWADASFPPENYRVVTAWTADRSENPLGNGWSQFRARETDDADPSFDNHTRTNTVDGYQDLYNVYNSMFQLISQFQSFYIFGLDGDYQEQRHHFDGVYNPLKYVFTDVDYQ
jgi:hypothetical protein